MFMVNVTSSWRLPGLPSRVGNHFTVEGEDSKELDHAIQNCRIQCSDRNIINI
jgi:hypothetical protein